VSPVVDVTFRMNAHYARCAFILNVIDHCQKYLDLVKFYVNTLLNCLLFSPHIIYIYSVQCLKFFLSSICTLLFKMVVLRFD